MSIDRTFGVGVRVLRQLRNDPRSIAMILIVPLFLLWILKETFQAYPGVFERLGPMLLGLFPYVVMFLVTSIVMLRERTQGTLDRMMVSPIGRGDIMFGYAFAFLVVAAIQSCFTLAVAVGVFDIPSKGALWQALLLVFAMGISGMALGLTSSAFARTEFQAVQFMPLLILPQIFLAGLMVPVDLLPRSFAWLSRIVPLSYSFRAIGDVMIDGQGWLSADVRWDTLVTLLVPCALLGLGTLTIHRSGTN